MKVFNLAVRGETKEMVIAALRSVAKELEADELYGSCIGHTQDLVDYDYQVEEYPRVSLASLLDN